MITIRQVDRGEKQLIGGLNALLTDAVHGGASVGFLAPLAEPTAIQYWRQVLESLGGALVLWVAESDGAVVGSVQLSLCEKENGRHRAEIQKLFVLTSYRGQGIAKLLLSSAEERAIALGRSLLVLDTEAGSLAESVYSRLGWTKAGEIPNYATSPDGCLRATAYYFKALNL